MNQVIQVKFQIHRMMPHTEKQTRVYTERQGCVGGRQRHMARNRERRGRRERDKQRETEMGGEGGIN